MNDTKKAKQTSTINYQELLPIPISNEKVFIHSIPKKSMIGLDQWSNDSSGKRISKNKIGDRANDKICALYSHKKGQLANGLSYIMWKHEGKQVVDNLDKPMTLQDKLELKWSLPKGHLTSRPWRKGDSLKESDLTFFQKETWSLRDGTTILSMNVMKDDVGYHMMQDHKAVANSQEEYRANKWAKATHYIALENESEQIKYQKTALKSKAFTALGSKEMTLPTRRKFVHILELASTRTVLTEEQIHNLLFDYIDNSKYTANSNIDKFLHLYSMLKEAGGMEYLNSRYLLREALDSRVVYEKQGGYNWPRPKGLIVLGENLEEAIEFLMNPKKEVLVEELQDELKAKKAI